LIIAVDKKDEKETIKILEDLGEKPYIIGYLEEGQKSVEIV
jgi:phosphoribosylformylglycinamidine cyclo-ligase